MRGGSFVALSVAAVATCAHGRAPRREPVTADQPTYQELYFNQTLDHFRFETGAGGGRSKWPHRYLMNDEHWTGAGKLPNGCKGPILFYTGNEVRPGPVCATSFVAALPRLRQPLVAHAGNAHPPAHALCPCPPSPPPLIVCRAPSTPSGLPLACSRRTLARNGTRWSCSRRRWGVNRVWFIASPCCQLPSTSVFGLIVPLPVCAHPADRLT